MEQMIVGAILIIVPSLLILLVCRGIVCWYFKINEHINDQYAQTVVLKKILNILESQMKNDMADKNEKRLGRRLYCQQCGEDITHMPAECPKCGKTLVYKEG